MSGRDGEMGLLLVDVEGLEDQRAVPMSRSRRWSFRINVLQGVLYLVLAGTLVEEEALRLVFVGLGIVQMVLGTLGLVLGPRVHLRLEPEGVRRVGVLGRGRLTPWTEVAEVRPPDAWHEVSHLRGHGRFPETTDLPELAADDARELRRRLAAAREGTVVRPEADGREA